MAFYGFLCLFRPVTSKGNSPVTDKISPRYPHRSLSYPVLSRPILPYPSRFEDFLQKGNIIVKRVNGLQTGKFMI